MTLGHLQLSLALHCELLFRAAGWNLTPKKIRLSSRAPGLKTWRSSQHSLYRLLQQPKQEGMWQGISGTIDMKDRVAG